MSSNIITTTPFLYRAGPLLLRLYPLTLSDWVFIDRLHGAAKYKNIAVTIYIVQQSLKCGYFKACFLVCLLWRQLPKMLDKIIEISTIHTKKADFETGGKKKDEGRELINAIRHLTIRFGWTPQQIQSMTMQQIHLYLAAGEDGTGVMKMDAGKYMQNRMNR